MGHNLRNITNMLGLSGYTDMAGLTHPTQPQGAAPGMMPSALLGQAPAEGELPPASQASQEIVVNGQQAAPPPQAEAAPAPPAGRPGANFGLMGAATPANVGAADPEYVARMRERQKNAEALYRDTYHHGSEFGTKGVLRDVIGNATDFGRRLLGFSPRYNEEKWAEKAGNMASTNPDDAAASRQAAMQYNPNRTMEYGKQLEGETAQRANTAATTEYKQSQTAQRSAQLLTGLGANLLAGANGGASPEQLEAQYQRALPAIQKGLDDTYGAGVMKAPEQFDPTFVAGLTRSGYSGTTYQRQAASNLSEDTKRDIANGKNLTSIQVAQIGADARRYAADANYRAAVNRAALQGQPIETTEVTTPSGSIISPVVTKKKTIVRAAGGAPAASAPTPTSSQRKFYNGRWYRRGPNGEAIPE